MLVEGRGYCVTEISGIYQRSGLAQNDRDKYANGNAQTEDYPVCRPNQEFSIEVFGGSRYGCGGRDCCGNILPRSEAIEATLAHTSAAIAAQRAVSWRLSEACPAAHRS
jgi:hypothetical protein